MPGKPFCCPGSRADIRKPLPWLLSWADQAPRRVSSTCMRISLKALVCTPLLNSPPFTYFAEKSEDGGWGLYSSGRIVHLHQPPGAKGDILELKFGYDYDGEIDKQAQVGEISGRITDY